MANLTEKEWAKVDHLVETLDISIAEAIEMLAEDKEIDRDKKLVKLEGGLEEGAKKARRAERKSGEASNRKEDADKVVLMEKLMGAVAETNPTQTKPGEFLFEFNGRRFKVVLSAPRT